MQTLIEHACILTNDSEFRVLPDGFCAFTGERITAVGSDPLQCARLKAEPDCQCIDAKGKVLMPGLVNAHTHSFQTFLRGFADHLPLQRWLREAIFPRIVVMEEEDFYLSSLLSCVENIKCGATSLIDQHYVHTSPHNADQVLRGMRESGIRGAYCRTFGDCNKNAALRETPEGILSELERLHGLWHGSENGRLTLMLGPGNAMCITPQTMQKTFEFARCKDLRYQMHILETRGCVSSSQELYGRGAVEELHHLGMLEPRMQLAHAVWLSPAERDLLQSSGAMVVHNPVANMYLASGVAPIREYVQRGIPVALGTDGPGSNNSQDMMEVLKATVCLQKVATEDAMALSNQQLLHMAWNGGAQAMGRSDLGSVACGKKADLVLVDLMKPHCMPVNDPVSAIIYNANGNDVSDSWVDGECLLRDGVCTKIDERALLQACQERQKYIQNAIAH